MQRKCRRRFHTAPNENDPETTEIDDLTALFAQYAKSAPLLTRRGTARRSTSRRPPGRSITFDCPEDSDEAAANWTPGTVPMCEKWFVFIISLSRLVDGVYAIFVLCRCALRVLFGMVLTVCFHIFALKNSCVCSIEYGYVHRDCVQCGGVCICHHRRRRRSCKICVGKSGKGTKSKRRQSARKGSKSGVSHVDIQT